MKRITLLLLISSTIFVGCKENHEKLKDGLYTEIQTSKGSILLSLDYEKAPITVANFILLAEGTNPFVTETFKNKPFYDGLKFHRVESNFMIQGGDPLGNGSGDAGYTFKDEFTDLKFDKGGVLAMANSGPSTNSSQFFITHTATDWLNGKHTIFGHVIEKGMDVVNSIVKDDAINSIKIIRKGEDAKKFDALKIFSDYFNKESQILKKTASENTEKLAKITTDKLAFFAEKKASAIKLPSGLHYTIYEKGSGKKPSEGTTIYVAYSGFLETGTLFDSSDIETLKAFEKLDPRRAAQNGYQNLPYKMGSKGAMIPGFEEGLSKMNIGDRAVLFIPSNLAYGENGAGNVIPPNSNIIFDVQMLENK